MPIDTYMRTPEQILGEVVHEIEDINRKIEELTREFYQTRGVLMELANQSGFTVNFFPTVEKMPSLTTPPPPAAVPF